MNADQNPTAQSQGEKGAWHYPARGVIGMSVFTGMVTKLTLGTMSFSDPDSYFGISIMLKDLGRDKEYPCNMPADLDGQSLSGYVFLLTTAMINGYPVETIQDDGTGYTIGVRILPA